jgi:hypothetical protein
MRASTTLRLAAAGSRVDVLRVTLTVAGSMLASLALLAAFTVAAVGPGDGPYTSDLLNQAGLHPGVVVALVGLCVPVLVLLAQCSRIGAPARDRRLAAVRLAGATPGDLNRVAGVEAGLAAAAGSLLGVLAYAGLRPLLDSPVIGSFSTYQADPMGGTGGPAGSALRLPTDVLPPAWSFAFAVAIVPVLVVLGTVWALRSVVVTPFGVLRTTRTRPPRVLPLVAVAAGIALFFAGAALTTMSGLSDVVVFLVPAVGLLLAAGGLLAGQGAITRAIGQAVAARTSRPALLLAGRRMIADPFAATRATAVVIAAALLAAGAQYGRAATLLIADRAGDDEFFVHAYDLVNLVLVVVGVLAALGLLVAAAEGIVARRRTYAAVVAAGTPRPVIARAVLAELLLPVVPSLVLATAIGTVAAMGWFGRTTEVYDEALNTSRTAAVPLPWTALAGTLGLAVAVTAATTALGLLFLRPATAVTELRAAA